MRVSCSDYIGKTFKNSLGLEYEVVTIDSYYSVTVRFNTTGYTTKARLDHVKRGAVRDRYNRETFGVGYLGDITDGDRYKALKSKWSGMMTRCYDENYHIKKPTYIGCNVSDYFQNFSNFYQWAKSQIGFDQDGWELDKDILVRNNKTYSEDTCCFIPREINLAIVNSTSESGLRLCKRSGKYQVRVNKFGISHSFGYHESKDKALGIYSNEKRKYLREIAEKWKEDIDPRVYQSLLNWKL
jgi:hypothetical protein